MNTIKTTQPILIVEDNDDDFEATERALKRDSRLANPIYRCENADDALDFLMHRGGYNDSPTPGLILLDLNMPGRGGRSLLADIKKHTKTRKIPVVVLTTSSDTHDVEECYAMGANTYIKKPVDLDGFFVAIKQLKEYWFSIALLPNPNSHEETSEPSDN